LVQMVDAFVSGIKAPGYSRSAVFEEALQMWKQSQRDQFDVQYYTENAVQLNDPDWTAITTKAADHIWKD
jgi:hypothetical protein